MTLPISDSGSAGILALDENFYEFIPESEIASPSPTLLTCAELEEGSSYYLILTTPGGLYRYDINDVVRVAGFFNRTPLIEFVRKGRDVTNITGEKLHVNQVIQAMAQAQSAADIAVQHFRACADVERSLYAFLRGIGRRHAGSGAIVTDAARSWIAACAGSISSTHKNAIRAGLPRRFSMS